MQRFELAVGRLVRRLHLLLQQLPVARRKQVLEARLEQDQRLVLEQWMKEHRAGHHPAKEAPPSNPSPRQGNARAAAAPQPTGELRARPSEPRLLDVRGDGCEADESPTDGPDELTELSARKGSSQPIGIARIHHRGECFYYAQMCVDGLYLMSKADRDLGTVVQYRQVLFAIKKKMAGHEDKAAANFERRFREAVQQSLKESGLDAHSMGLRFKVIIRALWLSRSLRTGVYSMAQIDAGLCAWRRLRSTRGPKSGRCHVWRSASAIAEVEEEWAKLSTVYSQILADAGLAPSSVQARLGAMHEERRAVRDRHLQAWERACMAREEAQQRKVVRQQHREAQREQALESVLQRWAELKSAAAAWRDANVTLSVDVASPVKRVAVGASALPPRGRQRREPDECCQKTI